MPDDTVVKTFDSLTDDELMALTPEQVDAMQAAENEAPVDEAQDPETPASEEVDPNAAEDNQEDDSKDPADEDGQDPEQSDGADHSTAQEDELDPEQQEAEEVPASEEDLATDDKTPASNDKKVEPKNKEEKPKEIVAPSGDVQSFYDKVTAKFKADGKDMEVKDPEDVVRMMQMGVNYSRRLAEMKPMRQLNQMLTQHGINDVSKLSYLIDLNKGDPAAIKKLLASHKIDPIDLDMEGADNYKNPNYQGDAKTLAFSDAITATQDREGGQEFINEVVSSWDDDSKEALRDDPSLFTSLLDQRDNGIYEKVNSEVNYQRNVGKLTNVSYIQAYKMVGQLMTNRGDFNSVPDQGNSADPVAPKAKIVDTGHRKAAKKKTALPNPSLSSQNQSRTPSNSGEVDTPDYNSMTDEQMMALGDPG